SLLVLGLLPGQGAVTGWLGGSGRLPFWSFVRADSRKQLRIPFRIERGASCIQNILPAAVSFLTGCRAYGRVAIEENGREFRVWQPEHAHDLCDQVLGGMERRPAKFAGNQPRRLDEAVVRTEEA